MHRETQDLIQITKADHRPLVGEVYLKLEQTPVRESLQADYDGLLQALQSLHHSEDTATISKFQLELLRNVVSAGALQGSALADTITEADNRLPENGTILLALI
jgi:hypothetical protein